MPTKQALLIRSASFQQLDKNLPELEQAFPDHEFSMLTHKHGVKLAEKYKLLKHIYVYPYKESFSYGRKPTAELEGRSFDSVIVPVANLTGAGFYNVLLFSLRIPAKRRFLCNMVSEIKEITMFSVIVSGLLNVVYRAAAVLFTLILMVPTILLLPLFLKRIQKR